MADVLSLWQARGDAALSTLALGDVPAGSSADTQFRVKNLSSVLTATGVQLTFTGSAAGELWLSADGQRFAASVSIGNLRPGSASPIVTLRRVTPAAAAAGEHSATLQLLATSWTALEDRRMAVTATPYGKFLLGLAVGQFNLPADVLKVLLTTSSYTPNVDTHEFLTDITNEVTGTGYTANGITLTGVTWAYDANNNTAQLNCDPVLWSSATFTARYAVIYKSTGTASTSRLIGYLDFGTNQSPVGQDFGITFSSGVLRIQPASA